MTTEPLAGEPEAPVNPYEVETDDEALRLPLLVHEEPYAGNLHRPNGSASKARRQQRKRIKHSRRLNRGK